MKCGNLKNGGKERIANEGKKQRVNEWKTNTRADVQHNVIKTSLSLIKGEHGVGVVQLPPQQGRAPTVHEPASGGQVSGHLHLDRRHWRGSSQQEPDPGL